jgi:hypothetical protein
MKTLIVGEREQADIKAQVEKVLRGLGNPEPPVRLGDVRELLRLDLQYYSSTDDSILRQVVSRVKVAGKQLLQRPTLLWDVVRKADLSALWLPDQQRILLDKDLPVIKHRWAESHEIAHSITEWHKVYLFGDSEKELNPRCSEQLEAEANYGAGQLLFLRDRFVVEARDYDMNLLTVKTLAKRFGNTITSTLWRYVEQLGSDQPMAALVTPHPHRLPERHDSDSPCKYFVQSPAFRKQFPSITEREMFHSLLTYCSNSGGGSLGSGEVILHDINGHAQVFWFETFFNRHEALTLAYYVRQHEVVVSFPESFDTAASG